MYIREVQVKNFGKLKNRQFHFSPGLNVIYGENGAGKSTLQQFLMAMLFGMEKSRGRAGKGNPYEIYEPWEAPAYYAGSMRFHTGGKEFYLERNFYHKERSACLVNERDKEELSVEQGDLQMLLGGVSKSAYENTFFIRQGMILPKAELGNCLMDELHNLAETGDGSFELSRSFEILQQERKALEKRHRQEEMKRNQQLELLKARERMLKEQEEKLTKRQCAEKERIIHLQQMLREQDRQVREQNRKGYDDSQKNRENRKVSSLFRILSGLILCILWLLICLFMPFSRIVWLVGQAVLLAFIAAGILAGGKRKYEIDRKERGRGEPSEDDRVKFADFRTEIAGRQAVLAAITEELQENEIELENNRSAQAEVMEKSGGNDGWDREIQAVFLAEETLRSLAVKNGEVASHQLDEAVSDIFCQITDGKYDKIVLSEKYEPKIAEGFKMRKPEAFSAGTMQQAYFAFRMAAGQFLEQEESLPFLLDEVFSMYDAERLGEALRWLGEQDRQIFLFTCQEREAECLRASDIPFREIILADED